MKLDIIVRTHNTSNVHNDRARYSGLSKTSLIEGCLWSLINSVNQLQEHDVQFVILDDHSTTELFDAFDVIFPHSRFPIQVIRLENSGYNHSALTQFQYCRDSDADLVYSIEDDYLHSISALTEMLDCYTLFKDKTGVEVALYPFDMPDDYVPPWMGPCHLVHGTKRHWRTGTWTTNTMLARPELFKIHWPLFEKLATEYSPLAVPGKQQVHEGNTICEIWRHHALRFSPIPSLALHMQFDTQMDPYIDWQQWWNQYAKIT